MRTHDKEEQIIEEQNEIIESEAQEEVSPRTPRTEIRRVQTGNSNNATTEEDSLEEGSKSLTEDKAKKRVWSSKLRGVLTGDILLAEEANRIYNYLAFLGVIFLISIFLMFGSFQQDLECSKLRADVALLKERAIRTSEAYTKCSSHSAILKELKRRGIELEDPSKAPTALR